MDNSTLLKKLGKLFNSDKLLTSDDVDAILNALITILSNNKVSIENLTAETKQQVVNLFEKITEQQYKLQELVDEKIQSSHEKIKKEVEKKVSAMSSNCMSLMEECKNLMPKDGKDADEEVVVDKVLEKIKLPEYEKFVLEGKGEQIVDEINNLDTSDDKSKIDISHIKGIEKLIPKQQSFISGGIVGRDVVKDYDLSSQLNGSKTTFSIPAVWNIISVSLSSYPYGSLRKGIDYTWTPTSITFTSEIDPSTQLSSGQKCILTIVTA